MLTHNSQGPVCTLCQLTAQALHCVFQVCAAILCSCSFKQCDLITIVLLFRNSKTSIDLCVKTQLNCVQQ